MAAARRFAATLGFIAFAFVAVLGVWRQAEVDWVLLRAFLALIVFSVVGFIAGFVASALIRHSADDELRRRAESEGQPREGVGEAGMRSSQGAMESETSGRGAGTGSTGDKTLAS